jgi:hypothetical protein
MLALAPECGCTLAWSAPKSAFTRSMASASMSSTMFVAAVVALARVALGVLVGEHRADRLHHGRRREVLARDELQAGALALDLAVDEVEHLGVRGGVAGERHVRTPARAP